MKDKFSLYQADGFWGIIEDSSDEKQTSVKSYIGADLIIKRLNEQAKQIDQLKQQNEELMLQLSKYEIEKHKPAYCTLAGTECEYLGNVDELKQQLEESFTEEDVEGLIEDRNKTIKFLQQQLAEKDKEIERLNTIKNNAIECADLFKVALSVRQKDLAIQELEKVKDWLNEPFDEDGCFKNGGDLIDYIDQQIKELKGEKDVED